MGTYNNETNTNKKRITYEAPIPNASLDYWENISSSAYGGVSGSQRRITYEAPTGTNDQWENTTLALYNAAATNARQITYEAPTGTNDFWEANTTQALYNAAATGGRRITYEATTGTNDYWENIPLTDYNTVVAAQKRITFEAPNSDDDQWEANTTLALYNAAGTTARRITYEAPSGTNDFWEANTTLALYNAAATNARRITNEPPTGTNDYWVDVTSTEYDAVGANSNTGTSDGWKTVVVGGLSTGWSAIVTSAQYTASNTTSDSTDGWRVVHAYPGVGPYDGHENSSSTPKTNQRILADLVAPGGATYAVYNTTTQSYGDVREVNMFVETNWARFNDAIRDVALGECGGTVTIQTKVGSGAAATSVNDPFTYSNLAHQTVETSSAYKSGTFDVVLPGAASSTIQINVENQSTLTAWQFVNWVCTEKGAALTAPAMQVLPPDSTGWRGITLNVAANTAISCIQTVAPK